MLVEVHDQRHGCTDRIAGSVGQDLRYVEHLQTTDQRCDHNVDKDRTKERQCDRKEDLSRCRTVNFGCLEKRGVDTHHTCHEKNGRISEPHKEVHKSYKTADTPDIGHELERSLENAQAYKNRVDRAGVCEQCEEKHCKCRRHDQVRQIDNGLEESLSL